MVAPARTALTVTTALAICSCGGDERVGLHLVRVPTASLACANVLEGNSVRVRALGDFPASDRTSASFSLDAAGDEIIESFPSQLESLAVEVLGPGGVTVAAGRTAPFDFDDADDGDELAVFLAPIDSACEVGSLAQARAGARAAAIGDGALILGGVGSDGAATTVELYDRALGQFTALSPEHFGTGDRGFVGTSLTTVGDRVLAVGGPVTAWQSWDADGSSDGPQFLSEARAFHSAVALADGRLFLAAGCAQVSSSYGCAQDSALRTTAILDPATGGLEPGPRLAHDRIAGSAFLDVDGSIVLVGGVDADGQLVASVERLELGASMAEDIAAAGGRAAAKLVSSSIVVGLGDSTTPSGALALVPGGGAGAVELGVGLERAGATLAPTEDGSVLIVGGGAGLARFRPLDGAQQVIDVDMGGARSDHVSVRLVDGSVLVAGGSGGDGVARADAWVIRPPLAGPVSNGDVSVRFGELDIAARWIPRDPSRLNIEGEGTRYAVMESSGHPLGLDLAVVGGPKLRTGLLTATVAGPSGLGIVLGFDGGSGWLILLEPGSAATLVELASDGTKTLSCEQAETVSSDDVDGGGGPVSLTAEVRATELVVRSGARLLLRCSSVGSPPTGYWGLSSIGAEGSQLRVDAVTVSRQLP